MSAADNWANLLERTRAGEMPAASRLISALEARSPGRERILSELHEAGRGAHVVGITGAPGTGKSTLVNALIRELRARGQTVGVVAVDPSSPISGGAILGDRIRMQEHALDAGVFVRSLSTRGWLGGVSRVTVDAVGVLDAAGLDMVIVETVGVGQDELEIVQIAPTTVIVSVPGLGDDVQTLKAGLLEVGDLHVVNKADRSGADKTAAELLAMLALGSRVGDGSWLPPVIATVAHEGHGIPELVDALDRHRQWLVTSGEVERRNREAAAARIRAIARDLLVERIQYPSVEPTFDALVADVAARRIDAETAAAILVTEASNADASAYLKKPA